MIAKVITGVRETTPLVHCLSAVVSMGIVADGLLAAGARPMMTETEAEAPVLVGVADALLINLGTLSSDALAGIPATVAAATVPWVLDPAAVGPTRTRRDLAMSLLSRHPAVIRANASEVLVLADGDAGGSGPDSTATATQALGAASRLASASGAVVAVSGKCDHVFAPGGRHAMLSNGSELLPRVVGTGCLVGALMAACCAVSSPEEAAITATTWLNVAAERAAADAKGPGSFRQLLIDELYAISPREVEKEARVAWI